MTPSKRRVLPGGAEPAKGDDFTDVTRAPAPWDKDSEDNGTEVNANDPDREDSLIPAPGPITQQTSSVNIGDGYDLAKGTSLGEYRIEGKIGQGGMGVVYAAVHPLIGKRAAIKILKRELCADPTNLERFMTEARVVNEIGHPNIVDIFAFGEMPDGRCYFVMEWLKGETLREAMSRGRLTLEEMSAILKPLTRALEAAHAKKIIHRDLKPDNVFLVDVSDDRPKVKLLDFGIAKLGRTDQRIERTATGAMMGTPQYIAPEQAKGYTIDFRADVYALGGIVFEMLTGRPPFVADNAMEIVAKHLMEAPPRPSAIASDVPPALDDLVLAMLAKDPNVRPGLAEIRQALDASLRASAVNIEPSQVNIAPLPAADSVPVAIPQLTPITPMHGIPVTPRPLAKRPVGDNDPTEALPTLRPTPMPPALAMQAPLPIDLESSGAVAGKKSSGKVIVLVLAVIAMAIGSFLVVDHLGKEPAKAVVPIGGSASVTDPVQEPVTDPVKPMATDPVKEPVTDPVKEPVKDPVKPPVKDPVKPTIKKPPTVKPPTIKKPADKPVDKTDKPKVPDDRGLIQPGTLPGTGTKK